jgi:maleate cis-trans isomerase
MYGWRGRIGLLATAINTTMEPEFWQLAPPGVSIHTTRVPTEREGTPETLRAMEEASLEAARQCAKGEPDVVVYGCTSGSFFEGPKWNEKIVRELSQIANAPAVTTAGAMAACLVESGVKRINVVTPYVELTNERLKQFLKAFGIEVVQLGTFDMLDMFDHAKIEPADVYAKVKEIDCAEAQAVFVACTQVRALEVVELLERDLGKPVYTANQASAWEAFKILGIDPAITDRGSLLRSLSKAHRATGGTISVKAECRDH